jgi:copper resistance protein C
MAACLARFASVCIVLGVASLGVTSLAFAHTAAIGTTPKSGSVLERSPPSIEITFKAPVRMTAVIVQQDGKPDRKLASSPPAAAATIKIENPQLEPGLNHVRWTALSQDGHVVKGVIELTIKPAP